MTPNEATDLASEFRRIAEAIASGDFKALTHWRTRARKDVSPTAGPTQKLTTSPGHPDGTPRPYWRNVSGLAARQAIHAAWGDRLAPTTTTIGPILVAVLVAVVTGALARSVLAGVAAGLAVPAAWTASFFVIKMITLPAKMHADLTGKLDAASEAIRAYNAVVDQSQVRNLLLRMREKCLAYRNNRVPVATQVQWAGELLADLSALYGPEAGGAVRRELPYLLDLKASPQTMDFYMRHLADRLLTQIDRVSVDLYSIDIPQLNGFVRRRLRVLQAEVLPANEPSVIKAVVSG